MRLDLFLVQNKLANSRTQAQDLIESGFVYLLDNNKKIQLKKPSYIVEENKAADIFVESNHLQKYVSRAGLKLEAALVSLNIDVTNKVILDIGQSTGGFTDCLIRHQALKVIGIDVGHEQLHKNLKNNSRIISIEGLNAKDLATDKQFISMVPADKFDMIVMDVSFISITKVIPHIVKFLKTGGEFIFLVKPQFECGQEHLDKNGIVKDYSVYIQIEENIKKMALLNFNNVESYIKSEIVGKDGNQEFFIYGKNCI